MKDAKLKLIIVSLIALIGANLPQPVSASEIAIATPVEKSVDELLTTKDDTSLTPEEKLAKEIDNRGEILKEALISSLEEVSNIKTKLEKLPDLEKDSKEKELKDKFIEELTNYEIYYKEQGNNLDSLIANSEDNETLNEDLKKAIIELKNYRENIYNPRFQKMVEFLILFYSADVLQITQTRFDKISNDISKLEKLGLIKTGYSESSMEKAAQLINDAGVLQIKAKALILNQDIPKKETADNTEEIIGDGKEPIPEPTPRELIETSLNKIKSAYDIFLQISKDIRKTLGM
jgi:hypothetical protein